MAKGEIDLVEVNGEPVPGTSSKKRDDKPNDSIDSLKKVLARAGFSVDLMRRHPEVRDVLKKLSNRIAKGKIDENTLYQEFVDLLNETKFGKRPVSEIQADLARYRENNADWKQRVDRLVDDIRRIAVQRFGSGIGSKATRDLAISLIYSGEWDDATIYRSLSKFQTVEEVEDDPTTEPVESGQTQLGGDAGTYQNELLRWFAANGVQVGANEMDRLLSRVMNGGTTVEDIKQDYRNRVFSAQYAGYADRFREGLDVTDVALSYRQKVSSLLELDQSSVGLDNRLVTKALEYVDPATNKARPMAGWEFDQLVRSDPEWQKTNNAYAQYASVGRDLLKSFGFEV